MPLVDKQLTLVLGKSGEGEHADLIGDMVPLAGGAHLFDGAAKLSTHVVDAVGHALALRIVLLA